MHPPKHVELLIPQHAGSVLIFTPPGTPRRGSAPCVDSSQLANGHPAVEDQPRVESEVHLMTTPTDFNFGAVELTLPYPYMNGEAPDSDKEAELQKMNAITDKLIESEEKYVDDLRSLAEVWPFTVFQGIFSLILSRFCSHALSSCILSLVYGRTVQIDFYRDEGVNALLTSLLIIFPHQGVFVQRKHHLDISGLQAS